MGEVGEKVGENSAFSGLSDTVLKPCLHLSFTLCSHPKNAFTCGLVVFAVISPQDVGGLRSIKMWGKRQFGGRRWGKVWIGVLLSHAFEARMLPWEMPNTPPSQL